MAEAVVVFLLGAPYAGKSTMAAALGRCFDAVVLSGGALLRQEARTGSGNDRVRASEIVSSGSAAPDELLFRLYRRFLEMHCGRPVLIDGNPRDLSQYRGIEALLDDEGSTDRCRAAVLMKTPSAVLAQRRSRVRLVCVECMNAVESEAGRCWICGGEPTPRADHTGSALANREEWESRGLSAVVDEFRSRGALVEVDGAATPDESVKVASSGIRGWAERVGLELDKRDHAR